MFAGCGIRVAVISSSSLVSRSHSKISEFICSIREVLLSVVAAAPLSRPLRLLPFMAAINSSKWAHSSPRAASISAIRRRPSVTRHKILDAFAQKNAPASERSPPTSNPGSANSLFYTRFLTKQIERSYGGMHSGPTEQGKKGDL